MQFLLKKILFHPRGLNFIPIQRHLHLKPKSIVIASAIRTPWGQPMGQLASVKSLDLASLVVETAVKQSGAPLEQIQQIFVAKEPPLEKDDLADKCGQFLKKSQFNFKQDKENFGLNNLREAIELLNTKKCQFVVVAGVESATERLQNKKDLRPNSYTEVTNFNETFTKRCKVLLDKASKQGLYDAELAALKTLKVIDNKRRQVEINQDEVSEGIMTHFDGAAAIVLTTNKKAMEENIKPLAVLADIEISGSDSFNLASLASDNDVKIEHCEVNRYDSDFLTSIQDTLNISCDQINPYGGPCGNQFNAASLYGRISHMSHILRPNTMGCLLSLRQQQSVALLMEKLLPPPIYTGDLPQLTLFTKEPCHLCDMLVEELQQHFQGEYNLEKIYIDTKENVRYLRLYRNDIPVLYLNGQFLCMHRLNIRLLRQKLDLLKPL
ncbi:uncharacterized protein LOC106088407 isoform X1 [Stomoxys calcitrans]|uniref:uncharacterized protein LOC106088407 isoform X1 n=2 Tax=Stomoxys calcitrans TaxID=35570 RepID=UPI0027E22F24|nr:uncharacterized protein LOC106088407 isoform X1 [Stomoxys calcitrans]